MTTTQHDLDSLQVNSNANSIYYINGATGGTEISAEFASGWFSGAITFYPRIYNINIGVIVATVFHCRITEILQSDTVSGPETPLTPDQLIGTYADTRTTFDITGGAFHSNVINGIGVMGAGPILKVKMIIEESTQTAPGTPIDLILGIDANSRAPTMPAEVNALESKYFFNVPTEPFKDDGKVKNWIHNNPI